MCRDYHTSTLQGQGGVDPARIDPNKVSNVTLGSS